ncbi:hypothetical protein ACTFIY_002717, partial [Dictyostelium cf. discoideum]
LVISRRIVNSSASKYPQANSLGVVFISPSQCTEIFCDEKTPSTIALSSPCRTSSIPARSPIKSPIAEKDNRFSRACFACKYIEFWTKLISGEYFRTRFFPATITCAEAPLGSDIPIFMLRFSISRRKWALARIEAAATTISSSARTRCSIAIGSSYLYFFFDRACSRTVSQANLSTSIFFASTFFASDEIASAWHHARRWFKFENEL